MPVQFREGGLAEVRLWRGTENAPLEEPTVKITTKAEVECSGLEPGTKYFVRARRGEPQLSDMHGSYHANTLSRQDQVKTGWMCSIAAAQVQGAAWSSPGG